MKSKIRDSMDKPKRFSMEEKIRWVQKWGNHRRGRKELLSYLRANPITRAEAIRAHCYECLGYGSEDKCVDNRCALYHFSQFAPIADRVKTKTMSEENKLKARERMVRMHKERSKG